MLSASPNKPLVSVLLPVRDGARWLDAALDSLARQTLEDFEVVAVDDGSTDATGQILRRRARRDLRMRAIARPPAGIAAALETARAAARGHYLARMDADDVARPERLERQLALLEDDPTLAGCGTAVEYFPRSALRSGALRYERWINDLVDPDAIARDVFVECPIPHPTFFLRAEAVDRIGGWRDAGWPEDYDLVLRLWEAGRRLGKVPEALLGWRERPDRLSRNHPAYSADAFRRCKVHFLERTLLEGRDGALVWGAGPTGKAFGRALRRAGVRVRGWVDLDPRKIGKRIHGAPVVAPDGIGAFEGALCVAAVGQRGARQEIRAALEAAGWREMEDYVAVA